MKQEDKDLLMKDLCMRLPYGVKGIITFNGDKDIFTVKGIINILFLSDNECCHVEDFKPYLIPISSMTIEQKEEERSIKEGSYYSFDANGNIYTLQDFYNKNHIDYKGLIPMGLANNATGLNIY